MSPMYDLQNLLTSDQIQDRVKELALEIQANYGDEELLFVGILKGSVIFMADLIRHFSPRIEIDFIQVSSYMGRSKSSGVVQIRKDLDRSIEGRKVLIVEDIVDTGLTLSHLRDLMSTRQPADLRVVSLLSKRCAKNVSTIVEYVGFEIADEFVVGYGLDYEEQLRNLPHISVLRMQSPSVGH